MSEEKMASLLAYVKKDGRICPNPQEWNILWEMLPGRHRVGYGWEPPLPLILGAWHEPALLKQLRLEEHIRYAANNGFIDEVDAYLRELRPEQWFNIKS